MVENKVYRAIGMMSGTSLDGIDICLVETDGFGISKLLDFKTYPYGDSLKQAVRAVFGKTQRSDAVELAENLITEAHIKALADFGQNADIIGFHGQTITHIPEKKFTWQIGDAQKLANESGIDVVADMRQADINAGGQGAPLLPICHQAFTSDIKKPIAILNLGGVGNVTFLGKDDEDILAFDTGPANALIDDLIKNHTGEKYDKDGKLAFAGKVNHTLVDGWLENSYFSKKPPKSLDRNQWDVSAVNDLELKDAVATLTSFTVRSILKSLEHLPKNPKAIYVAGGGVHNKAIMKWLNEELSCPIVPAKDIGLNSDALEAQGFAYLAVRSLKGLHLTLPSTTGVSEPLTGGKLYKPCDNVQNCAIKV